MAATVIKIDGVDVTRYIDIDAGPDAGNPSAESSEGTLSSAGGGGGTFQVVESPAQSMFTFQ